MPSSQLPALCALSPSCHLAAYVTTDNRIKVWDTQRGAMQHEYTEDFHLTLRYSCLAAAQPDAHTSSSNATTATTTNNNKKKRSSAAMADAASSLGLLALGSRAGRITVWNLAAGTYTYLVPDAAVTPSVHTSSSSSPLASTADPSASSSTAPASAHTGTVTSLVFSPDGQSLFSAGDDRTIKAWKYAAHLHSYTFVSSFHVSAPVHAMCLSPKHNELFVSSGLTLYSISMSTDPWVIHRLFTGMSSNIHTLDVSSDGSLLLSASEDRFVSVWPIDAAPPSAPGKKVGKKAPRTFPVHTFTLSQNTLFASFQPTQVGSSTYVLAVLTADHVTVLSYSPSVSTLAAITPVAANSAPSSAASVASQSCIISLPSGSALSTASSVANARHARTLRLQVEQQRQADRRKKDGQKHASLMTTTLVSQEMRKERVERLLTVGWKSSSEIVIARGENGRVLCDTLAVRDASGALQSSIELTDRSAESSATPSMLELVAQANSDHVAKKLKKGKSHLDINVASPMDAPATVGTSDLSSSSSSSSSADGTTTSSSTNPLHMTLAERLASLEEQAGTFGGDMRVLTGTATSATSNEMDGGVSAPRAGSLQTLLTQALHTNDASLFEYCLTTALANVRFGSAFNSSSLFLGAVTGKHSISTLLSTVQRVPTPYVLPLLQRLVSMMFTRPSRALVLLLWIKAVLTTHTSYLLSLPESSPLTPCLTSLYSLMDGRLSAARKMRKLKGRLELIIAQIRQDANGVAALAAVTRSGAVASARPVRAVHVSNIRALTAKKGEDDEGEDQNGEQGDVHMNGHTVNAAQEEEQEEEEEEEEEEKEESRASARRRRRQAEEEEAAEDDDEEDEDVDDE